MARTAPDRMTEILELLRANGGRITTARRAILRAFLEHDDHITAEQLTAIVQRQHPDVAESTVYRFLDDLEQLDVVDHIHLGHGPAVYHLAEHAHHHLVCEECGTVVEVPTRVFAAMLRSIRNEHGFEVDLRHFAIPGRCRDCQRQAFGPTRP